jgi:hypothetical protein
MIHLKPVCAGCGEEVGVHPCANDWYCSECADLSVGIPAPIPVCDKCEEEPAEPYTGLCGRCEETSASVPWGRGCSFTTDFYR